MLVMGHRFCRQGTRPILLVLLQGLVLAAGYQAVQVVEEARLDNLTEQSSLKGFAHPSFATSDLQFASSPPALVPKIDYFRLEQVEITEKWLYRPEEMHNRLPVYQLGYMGLTTKVHTFVFNDAHLHAYDSLDTLRKSFGPHVDHQLCMRQLEHLAERANVQNRLKYSGKDINFHLLMDTYGRVPPGLHLGNSVWPGMYHECLRLKILDHEGVPRATRYCWGSAKHPDWIKNESFDHFVALKGGLCIPKSCDALPDQRKFDLLMNITSFNLRHLDHGQSLVDRIYCLPDDDSEVHSIWKSPVASLLVAFFASWIVLVCYATLKHEQAKSNESVESREWQNKVNGSARLAMLTKRSHRQNLYESLSVVCNLRKLFDTSKTSQLFETANSIGADDEKKSEIATENVQVVDLSVLEGIKVICMCYVITGHVLMCMSMIMSNGREMTTVNNVTFFISNMVPAFAVNSFFTITGLLTTYLMFKSNQARSLALSPSKWVAFVVYRYLRIMPMYLLAVIYAKHLAKHTGSGPFWDYGTSSLSPRYRCREESWFWTLTFTSNFKPPLDHCVVSAWYLANDFQFALVTPIFLTLLSRSPRVGRLIIKVCAIAGYIAGIMSIMSSDAPDLRPVANFMPHGFKTYVTFLSASYTQPQYRIPAYLCGILLGHTLLNYEKKKQAIKISSDHREDAEWPEWFRRYGLTIAMLCITFCCAMPTASFYLEFSRSTAKILVALFMSSYHVVFALSVGSYILLATTGHGNRLLNDFLSAQFWKPLARLSLSVVMINVEVVSYFIQTSAHVMYVNFVSQTALNLFCIVLTYLVAIVVCILFEAPMRTALNQIVILAIQKVASKRKSN